MSIRMEIVSIVPVSLAVPVAACIVCWREGRGFAVARIAAIAAGAGWLINYITICHIL